jgi:hypothetical protein
MSKNRSWTNADLVRAVSESKSVRQVIKKLNLIPAGGNYSQVKRYIEDLSINTSHFTGQAWNRGMVGIGIEKYALKDILIRDSHFQSHKLKLRLFKAGLKKKACEKCGWARISRDGRIPLELDHINGNRKDNRLLNLRILCPNCHSLEPTHRGCNKNAH